uniref:Uncharacterized protein n=1 Tax=Hucho hucho TaxID=62062 RepID=A0A4W5LR58_9TELE
MFPVIHGFWLGYVRTVTVGTTTLMHLLMKPMTDVVYSSMPFEESRNIFQSVVAKQCCSLASASCNHFFVDRVTGASCFIFTIHTLVNLYRHYVAAASKLTPAEEDSVWQVIVLQRQEVGDMREDCKMFESNYMMVSVTAQSSLQVAPSHKNLKDSQRITLPAYLRVDSF